MLPASKIFFFHFDFLHFGHSRFLESDVCVCVACYSFFDSNFFFLNRFLQADLTGANFDQCDLTSVCFTYFFYFFIFLVKTYFFFFSL